MPPTLTPDVCGRIVRWTRRGDLTALCLTCKSLQHEAEAKLYEIVMSANVQITFRACQSIISQPRLGPYVHSFCFLPDSRRAQREIPEQFWTTLQLALSRMRSLEHLFLQDPTFSSSWVLSDIAHIPFQLLEAKLLFYWDTHLVKFLESQNKLKSLHTIDGPVSDTALHLEAGSLPELRTFDGPLPAAEHIVHIGSTLTHLQVVLDKNSEVDVLTFIPKLIHLASSLRALSILHLPEGLSVDVFRSITKACPQLRHIGTIPLPLPRNVSHPPFSSPQTPSSEWLPGIPFPWRTDGYAPAPSIGSRHHFVGSSSNRNAPACNRRRNSHLLSLDRVHLFLGRSYSSTLGCRRK